MKKFFLLVMFLLLMPLSSSYADEGLENFSDVDRAWDGQKSITNKEFEQAIDTLEGNKKKKEEKQRKKLIKRIGGGGTSLHPDLSPDSEINDLTPMTKNEDGMLLNVPVNLLMGGRTIEKGYYKVIAQREDNEEVYLLFYQSHSLKGKIKGFKTDSDFGEEFIDFVKLLPVNENYVKIIYGSLDFNLYTYVKLAN